MSAAISSARVRAAPLAAALALAACHGEPAPAPRSTPRQQVAGSFVAEWDAAAGTLSFSELAPGDEPLALAVTGTLLDVPVVQDGRPGEGPPDTVELQTLSTAIVPDGCGPGREAFEGVVRLRSFYASAALVRPHVEILSLAPSGRESCGGVPSQDPLVSDALGLFGYADVPPLGAAEAKWSFRAPDRTRFTFVGRVVAEVVERTAPVTTPSPAPGTYTAPLLVTLACDDAGGSGCEGTRYALGGGAPSLPYAVPIVLTQSTDVCFASTDVAGNVEAPRCVRYEAAPAGAILAAYDPALMAPRCGEVGRSCDTGPTLVLGRATLGPEPNQPNTIGGSCKDGASGSYHSDESLDRLSVATLDGGPLAPGKTVRIEATVWAFSGSDALDLYHAPDASAPSWSLVATLKPPAGGPQRLAATFTLPAGGLQAIRGNFRYSPTPGACTAGSWDERDDLVFPTAAAGPPDVSPSTVAITSPAGGATVARTILVRAEASADVTRVDFWADGVPFAQDASPPWVASLDTGGLAPSTVLRAQAWDASGNAVWSPDVTVWVEDRTPPSIQIAAPAGGHVAGAAPLLLLAEAEDAAGPPTVSWLVDGLAAGTGLVAEWDPGAYADGPHTIVARATDAAGNTAQSAPVVFVLDRTPPVVALLGPADGTTVDHAIAATATASDPHLASVEYLVDGAPRPLAPAPQPPDFAATLSTSGLAPGAHALAVRATDSAGNSATSPPVGLHVLADATAPGVSILRPSPGAALRTSVPAGVQVDASDARGVARVELWVDGALADASTTGPGPDGWWLHWTPAAEGAHVLEARAFDAAGNDARSTAVAVVADGTGPTVALTAPAAGAVLGGTVAVGATAADANGVERVEFWSGSPAAMIGVAVGAPHEILWDTRGLPNGARAVYPVAYDRAGNATAGAAVTVTVRNGTLASYVYYTGATCGDPSVACLSGALLDGRGAFGTEIQPSTGWNTCPDGTAGAYHASPSIDAVDVHSADGGWIRTNEPLRVEILAWITDPSQRVDLWADLALHETFVPTGTGPQTFTTTLTRTQMDWVQLRANLRTGGVAAFCTTGSTDDHDDLKFFVTDNPNPPSGALTSPADGAAVKSIVTLRATASDDTAVDRVEFLVNGELLASDATAPYEASWNTALLPDGSYTVSCTVRDVSRHLTPCSGAATVSVANTFSDLLANGGFETGSPSPWVVGSSMCVYPSSGSFPAHTGAWLLRVESSTVSCAAHQQVAIPATAGAALLKLWVNVITQETGYPAVDDRFEVRLLSTSDATLETLGTLTHRTYSGWGQLTYDVSAYRGQTVRVSVGDLPNASGSLTYFLVDDVELLVSDP